MDNLELLEKLAQVMGVPTTEIKAVEDTAAGIVARMLDGSSYIKVPKDNPDSEGKTGLMYLRAPTKKCNGTFPVFAGGAPAQTRPGRDLRSGAGRSHRPRSPQRMRLHLPTRPRPRPPKRLCR